MKEITKGFLIALGLMVCIIIGVEKCTTQEQKPVNVDSVSIAIDSMKAEYQYTIDSLEARKPETIIRIKTLREKADTVYVGADKQCMEIINRKNNLITALDSQITDLETENTAHKKLEAVLTSKIEIDSIRFERDLFHVEQRNTEIVDSLKAELKVKKQKLFWQKVKTGVVGVVGLTGIIYSNIK